MSEPYFYNSPQPSLTLREGDFIVSKNKKPRAELVLNEFRRGLGYIGLLASRANQTNSNGEK
jgi:hypothetical protein